MLGSFLAAAGKHLTAQAVSFALVTAHRSDGDRGLYASTFGARKSTH
jgi:hypothetical protein